MTTAMPRTATTLSAAVLLLALSACGAGPTDPTPTPTATVAAPAPTPTTATPAADSLVATAERERQVYLDMSLDEFTALPYAEKARFVALTDAWLMRRFIQSWAPNFPDTAGPIPTAARENTAEEIVALSTWQERLAFALSGDDREKYIRAMLWSFPASSTYQGLANVSGAHPDGLSAASMNVEGLFVAAKSVQSMVEVERTNYVYSGSHVSDGSDPSVLLLAREIAYYDPEVTTALLTNVFVYDEVTMSDGTVVPLWRQG